MSKKFKHLNLSPHWQQYFSKYPQGYTIIENLIDWVSQVDDMVDNQNELTDNVEQFRNEIDDFVGRFDERLQTEVTQTLTEWQNSGFLDVVISEGLQWQLDDYITTNEQDKLSLTTQLAQTATNILTEGAIPNDNTVDNADVFHGAFPKNHKTIIPKNTYYLTKFQGIPNQHVDGMGSTLKLSFGPSPVMASLNSNSIYENIIFESLEEDLRTSRVAIEDKENIIIKNCTFKGFRNPSFSDAWGLYLKRSKNIFIINCKFENNTQSDIAILEGCKNITIINPIALDGENLHLNLEPNDASSKVENINVIGGHFSQVSISENGITISNKNINFNGVTIDLLRYRGASVTFTGSKIKKIDGRLWDGQIDFGNSIIISENLIKDSRLGMVVRRIDGLKNQWMAGHSSGLSPSQLVKRKHDNEIGRYLSINPEGVNTTANIGYDLEVNEGKNYLIALTGRSTTQMGSGYTGQRLRIFFRDSAGDIISDKIIRSIWANQGEKTPLTTSIAITETPAGTESMEIVLGMFNTTNIIFDVVSVSVHEIIEDDDRLGNTDMLKNIHYPSSEKIKIQTESLPTTNNLLSQFDVGDIVYIPPTAGGYEKYICVGAPYVMKGVGLIES